MALAEQFKLISVGVFNHKNYYNSNFINYGKKRSHTNQRFAKGDILWADDTENHPHPIVFLEMINVSTFKACILSTKPTGGNIQMDDDHFEKGWSLGYKNSKLVVEYTFEKLKDWTENPIVVGKLSAKGLLFVDSNIINVKTIHCNMPIKDFQCRINN